MEDINIKKIELNHNIVIHSPSGEKLTLDFNGRKLITSGDLPYDKASKIFFDNLDAVFKLRLDKEREDLKKEIIGAHNLVVSGLVNGLTHTIWDGRREDINFWRKRSHLFERFSKFVMNILTNQTTKYDLKELKEIAKDGYKND